MIASDLQVSLPTVNRRTPAVVTARLVARGHLGALIVADDPRSPRFILLPLVIDAILAARDDVGEGV